MFLAAMPWTYWLTFPLLVGSVMVLLSFTLVYLKKVVEPHLMSLDALAAARATPQPAAIPRRAATSRRAS